MTEEEMMRKRDELAAEIKRILDRKDAENATLRAEVARLREREKVLVEALDDALNKLEAFEADGKTVIMGSTVTIKKGRAALCAEPSVKDAALSGEAKDEGKEKKG